MKFLPVSPTELESYKNRGLNKNSLVNIENETGLVDFVLVTGDAYVDHPSFGAAIIGRLLESHGYSVGVISQPDIKNKKSFSIFGKPKYAFLVTSGNVDSMVNHYSVARKPRSKDVYSPNGQTGLRPDRATIVYSNKIRETYKDIPIILGGLEASLRRLAHYDYWDNKVRRSVLLDSAADVIIYGMGEHQIIELANALQENTFYKKLHQIRGIVYKLKYSSELDSKNAENARVGEFLKNPKMIKLPNYTAVQKDTAEYAKSFKIQYDNTDPFQGKILVEQYGNVYVIQNTQALPLTQEELDKVYDLPYVGTYHSMYDKLGGVPAIEEVKFSLISSRGCFGSCNFCALTFHQGRIVQSRSHNSLIKEAEKIINDKDFKGYIHDVGGPTANFRSPACKKQLTHGACKHKECLTPKPCENLYINHKDYAVLLDKIRKLPKVKKVFVRSGIRYDYLIRDKDTTFFRQLVKHHISGQLKVAPEHVSERVLKAMGKPSREVYDEFTGKYTEINNKCNMNQFIVPYFMSSHPNCTLEDAIELAIYIRDIGHMPKQVQDFYPTPGTMSTCMYYTEINPITNEKVYVPKNPHEKALQRALIQYKLPQNYDLVHEALTKANRTDLIGFDKSCLIRPKDQMYRKRKSSGNKENTAKNSKPLSGKTKTEYKKKKTIRNVHKKK